MLRLLALLLWLAAGAAHAQQVEVIRDFTSRIEVQLDGAVEVVEEIEVVALGQAIRRGIYRDLRLRSIDPAGVFKAGFTLHKATRNGQPETARVEGTGAGVRIWLGHPEVILPHGVHRYRLRYRITDEIRRFDGFDELYWNVNGTAWSFPTLRLSAEVVLPEGASQLRHAAYTGRAGERGRDVRVTVAGPRHISFATTRPLAAGENLSVAVAFPSGIVALNERFILLRWLVGQDPLHVGVAVLALLLAYYGFVWWRVGRDPPAGTIIPVYRPELPPAAMRFIEQMRFDRECTAAAMLNLAVKGHLTLEQDAAGKTVLVRAAPRAGAPAPSAGEAVLLAGLLGGRDRIALVQANQRELARAQTAFQRHLDATFNRVFFRRNRLWSWPGFLITVMGWLLLSLTRPDMLELMPFLLTLGFFTAVALALPVNAAGHLRKWRRHRDLSHFNLAMVQLLFAGLLGSALAFIANFFAQFVGWELLAAGMALIAVNVLFRSLLKRPTEAGRRALDEIEGTRLYLTVAEAERLRFHNPPDRTPEHFEAMLPYAVALGVETAWTDRFSEVLAYATAEKKEGHRPSWHPGHLSGVQLARLGHELADSYGAAAAPPSSSSGSGGGGSSGGGGGGGGGGGW